MKKVLKILDKELTSFTDQSYKICIYDTKGACRYQIPLSELENIELTAHYEVGEEAYLFHMKALKSHYSFCEYPIWEKLPNRIKYFWESLEEEECSSLVHILENT